MLLGAKLSILFDLAASSASSAASSAAEAEAKAGVDVGAGGAAQVQGDRGVPQHCGA